MKPDTSQLKTSLKTNEKLLNNLILLLGIVLLLIGVFVSIGEKWAAVLTGIGCSLIASAIVSKLNAMYIQKREEERVVIDKWGLRSVYSSRQEMNVPCDQYLHYAVSRIDMIGFGYRSLRDSQDKLMREKASKGVCIRIISMNPDSKFLIQREKDEKVVSGSIRETILQLKDWVDELKSLSPDPEKIEVRFYDSLPQDFYFRVDDHVFVGPYQYGRLSQQTISYEYADKNSEGFCYYTGYFEDLWNDKNYCKKLN